MRADASRNAERILAAGEVVGEFRSEFAMDEVARRSRQRHPLPALPDAG
jgi:hypothetical protein